MSDEGMPAWARAMEERLNDQIGGLGDRVNDRVDSLGARLDRTRADIMERVDRLQDTLTEHQADSVVPLGTAEMALKKVESTRSDLQTLTEMVLALNRVVRLQGEQIRQLRGDTA